MANNYVGGKQVSDNPHYHPEFEEYARDTSYLFSWGEAQSYLKLVIWLIKT